MKLKDWLNKNGVKATFLADKIGVHRSYISQWVSGRVRPSIHNAVKIAKATNGEVLPQDFIAGDKS